jgi:ABC-2 type transport system permease protein
MGFLAMASAVGVFDGVTVTTTSLMHMNSPYMLNSFIEGFNNLLYFLFPSIIGASIYRDYQYNAHHILYSYPFSKPDYLLGKFLSSFLITLLISLSIGAGIFIATFLPWANEQLIGTNHLWSYVQVYLMNVIPNMIFIGVIVFVVTTLSRSVYVGFVSVVILLILQGIINGLTGDMNNEQLAALLEPSGMEAINYYTKYWTVDEYNFNNLPLEKWYILNRLIWMGVAVLFLVVLGKLFAFSQQTVSISFRKKQKGERLVKNNFVGLARIVLPKVDYNFSRKTQWVNVINFTKLDFKYLAKNKVFMILVGLGILMMVLVSSSSSMLFGTSIYPVTRVMLLLPGSTFKIVILVITFLGAGLLVHRGKLTKMDLLVDSTAVPNWVLFTSKLLALVCIQATLLLVVMAGGILIQSYHGYYNFEIGLYLQTLLGIDWIWYIIWAGLALAVQTFFKNYLVGFFVLLLFFMFGGQLSKLGIEQQIFFFNKLPGMNYSDMNGFGSGMAKYFIYAFYWLLFIGFLSGLSLLFWRRGVFSSLKERFYFAKKRAKASILMPSLLCLIGFIALGSYLYYENTVLNTFYSAKETEQLTVEYEKKYKKYEGMLLPRIVDVKVDVDLYPKERNFEARGLYILKNKNQQSIDSVLVSFNTDMQSEIEIKGARLLSKDTIYGFSFYRFDQPLEANEEVKMSFVIKNKPNTILRNNSPVLENGTFINNSFFPSLGYSADGEFTDDEIRKKYGLAPKERMAEQTDQKALQNTYINHDWDWITFETTVSTSKDQTAIAPGYLQREWEEGDRRYFHYKMDQKMLNFYAFNSARYEVKRDKWNDINIEIYYRKGHEYNVDRMIKGVKKSLDYYTAEYSPYQHKQVRIIEFPNTMGTFAQSFANTIPFSESIGFIADVDEENEDAVDYPFAVTAHEVAHQWWAHQVIGANVQGVTMLSESLSEYSSLKVLEHEYGKGQMRKFLKEALDSYLSGRGMENKKRKTADV